MTMDFTLHSVMLHDAGGRVPRLWDLDFQGGRLSERRPAVEPCAPRAFLTPGFHDAHVHMLHEGMARTRCDLGRARSLSDALGLLAEYCRRQPPHVKAIWGERWDESRWPERRGPTGQEIDRIESRRPVILRRICGHRAALNSAALCEAQRALGPLPSSGQLVEEQAWGLANLWPPTSAERESALLAAQESAWRMGITRVSEMGGTGALETYRALAESGGLGMDVLLYVRPTQIDELLELRAASARRTGGLQWAGVKLFTDGSVGARTAALRIPYQGTTENRGMLLQSDAVLFDTLRRCYEHDLPVAIHAIGDGALDQVMRALGRLPANGGRLPPGWVSIEHAELLDEGLLEAAGRLGVTLSMQPNFVAQWGGAGGLYEEALGRSRWARMNPFREVCARNIPLTFGSDCMPMDPALGLKGAAKHPCEQARLSAEEAFRVYLGRDQIHPDAAERTDWWRPGADGFVLYLADPLQLAHGPLEETPVAGLLWRGVWVRTPEDALWAGGVLRS